MKTENRKFYLDLSTEIIHGDEKLYRIVSKVDMTLINGFKVKKGDIGGYVNSADRISEDGLC